MCSVRYGLILKGKIHLKLLLYSPTRTPSLLWGRRGILGQERRKWEGEIIGGWESVVGGTGKGERGRMKPERTE